MKCKAPLLVPDGNSPDRVVLCGRDPHREGLHIKTDGVTVRRWTEKNAEDARRVIAEREDEKR